MTGKRNARADIKIGRFIPPGHERRTPWARTGCATGLIAISSGCAGDFSTLAPAGPAAARAAELWWIMLAGGVLILLGVMGLAIYAMVRSDRAWRPSHRLMLAGGGLVFPVVTMAALMVFAFVRGEQLIARPGDDALTIGAHASQWAWTFSYPDGGRTTGILHVPANETFHVKITSEDVIHSFWAPQLGGKMDAIPGKENLVALRAESAGVFRGVCSEFCGVGHAQMFFEVHAHEPEDYASALRSARDDPDDGDPPAVLTPRGDPVWLRLRDAAEDIINWLGGG